MEEPSRVLARVASKPRAAARRRPRRQRGRAREPGPAARGDHRALHAARRRRTGSRASFRSESACLRLNHRLHAANRPGPRHTGSTRSNAELGEEYRQKRQERPPLSSRLRAESRRGAAVRAVPAGTTCPLLPGWGEDAGPLARLVDDVAVEDVLTVPAGEHIIPEVPDDGVRCRCSPLTLSLPGPPKRSSFPLPPVIVSLPSVPVAKSSPLPPTRVSLPSFSFEPGSPGSPEKSPPTRPSLPFLAVGLSFRTCRPARRRRCRRR